MKRLDRRFLAVGLGLLLVGTLTVGRSLSAEEQETAKKSILLSTTTSTQDSGLLEVLIPLFERQTGYTVKTIAVGSGQALAMGGRGDADVVLAHAPDLEMEYVNKGLFVDRRLIMHNDFVLLCSPADPAKIRGLKQPAEALSRIASGPIRFVTRGDKSGTDLLEKSLWKLAGIQPKGAWYMESGQGMGASLLLASEKGACILSDRGTYLAFKPRLRMEIVLEGDRQLLNIYHVMLPNPEKFPKLNAAGGKAFADFLLSHQAQEVIGQFGKEKFGSPLFFPDAGKQIPNG